MPSPDAAISDVGGPVLTINSSAARGYALAAITGLLRIAGGALIAHGLATKGQVDALLPGIAQQLLGFAIAGAGQGWAWWREHHQKSRLLTAALTDPAVIQIK